MIVRGNSIVSLGFNKLKTHPKAKSPYQQLHAEISAILAVDRPDFSKCGAYTYREHKDGTLALSKPCTYCQAALAEIGIEKAFFTSDEGYKEMNLTT